MMSAMVYISKAGGANLIALPVLMTIFNYS